MNTFFKNRSLISVLNRVRIIRTNKKMKRDSIKESIPFRDVKLTKDEISLIKSRWDVLGWSYELNSFKTYKYFCGFNPDFIPEELYYPIVHSTLNPYVYRKAFADKSNYTTLFRDIKQPEMLLRMVNGVLYDSDGETINLASADRIFLKAGQAFIKPSIANVGNGCKMIDDTSQMEFGQLLHEYPGGFVLQKPVAQSAKTAVFNEKSLNCFRVTSVNVNGVITAPTVCFKFGRNGLQVDNVARGGCIIGVNQQDGSLEDKAYCLDMSTIDNVNGLFFKDMAIDGIGEIVEFAIYYHKKYFTDLGIIGWDIALDDHDSPMMVEANTDYPGVHLEQIASRKPIFGDRTEEVVKWCLAHPIRHIY
jgi:hypothetical protein